MQQLDYDLILDGVAGRTQNTLGQPSTITMSLGMAVALRLFLYTPDRAAAPSPTSPVLTAVLDVDFDHATPVVLAADRVSVDEVDGVSCLLVEFDAVNSERLLELINGQDSLSLKLEVNGFPVVEDSEEAPRPDWRVQISTLTITNTIAPEGTGPTPTPVEDLYVTPTQLKAWLAPAPANLFSYTGGADPGHAVQLPTDRYIKWRQSGIPDSQYTEWIQMIQGPAGSGLAVDGFGLLADRDSVSLPFGKTVAQYYATDTGLIYFGTRTSNVWTWSDGVDIRGPQGHSPVANPATEGTILSAEWGSCIALDSQSPVMTLSWADWESTRARWLVVSATSGIEGNVVIIPIVNGIEQPPVVIAVTSQPTEAEFDFAGPVYSSLAFRRDYDNPLDTLRDGSTVALLVINHKYLALGG